MYFHDFSHPVDDLSLPFVTQSLTAENDLYKYCKPYEMKDW